MVDEEEKAAAVAAKAKIKDFCEKAERQKMAHFSFSLSLLPAPPTKLLPQMRMSLFKIMCASLALCAKKEAYTK